MHTLMVVGGGIVLLAVMLISARLFGGDPKASMRKAALLFLPVWLAASLVNMWVGVTSAGYTVMQELPILIPVFGAPAAVAGIAIWHFSRNSSTNE